jgi:hypothetical protein
MDWALARQRASSVTSAISTRSACLRLPRMSALATRRVVVSTGALLCALGLLQLLHSCTCGDSTASLRLLARFGLAHDNANVRAAATADALEKPPDKRALGRATWTAFHAMAANFPEKPTRAQQADGIAFVRAISKLYPCVLCRDHFDRYVAVKPPEYVLSASNLAYSELRTVQSC